MDAYHPLPPRRGHTKAAMNTHILLVNPIKRDAQYLRSVPHLQHASGNVLLGSHPSDLLLRSGGARSGGTADYSIAVAQ